MKKYERKCKTAWGSEFQQNNPCENQRNINKRERQI